MMEKSWKLYESENSENLDVHLHTSYLGCEQKLLVYVAELSKQNLNATK